LNSVEDPVLYDFPLDLRKNYYPLGFTVSVATNSEDVLAAMDESWGMFSERFFPEGSRPEDSSKAPMRIRVAVSDSEGRGTDESLPPVVRAQGNLISFIGDAENFSIADLASGFGFSWVTRPVAQRHEIVRYYYLDSMILTLIDALYASTMHAACVVLDGCGVLLCGPSTAGKSSLAYACARQGWKYLSDDATCLLRDRTDRTVVGNPYRLRLRPDGGRLFPEFKERLSRRRPNGKMSIEIATSEIATSEIATSEIATSGESGIKLVSECQVRFVVFLEREQDASPVVSPVTVPFSKESALAEFARTIPFGSIEQRRSRIEHYRNLLEVPVFRLRYSGLEGAIACLSSMVMSRN
jgi:hypothetical protein